MLIVSIVLTAAGAVKASGGKVGIGAGSGRLEAMRFLCLPIALIVFACSSAPPSPTANAPQACDVLPLLGKATPSALATDDGGGIALPATPRRPPLRPPSALLHPPRR